jgi:hypothetical protein
VSRTSLSIQVELIESHGEHLWPLPGRILSAARSHTFEDLADVIDGAFADWNRSYPQEFTLCDGTRLTYPDEEWGGLIGRSAQGASSLRNKHRSPPRVHYELGV